MSAPRLPGGFGRPVRAVPLSGGDVGEVWRVTLADDRTVVVKETAYAADLEAEGLRALADAGAPVPRVLAVEPRRLVLEHVTGPADWEALGRDLARVHRCTGDEFGWHRDNVIGPLPQRNTPEADWPGFFARHRIAPHLAALPPEVATRLEQAARGPLHDLLAHDAPPSLLHGDLWTGNIVAGRWLIDPAVHRGDRETDLAMLALFGDAPPAFHDAYARVWPLDEGWRRRRPALQLAPLLVHVRLFGGGYLGAVVRRLDELGW